MTKRPEDLMANGGFHKLREGIRFGAVEVLGDNAESKKAEDQIRNLMFIMGRV